MSTGANTFVIGNDNLIYNAGDNSQGQLGLGFSFRATNLANIINSTGKTPTQIACGTNHTIVLMSDGTMFGTGGNGNGQLGVGDAGIRSDLTQMTNFPVGKSVSQIACGDSHTIVLMTDGTIYATGNNGSGQLGLGNTTQQTSLTLMNTVPVDKTPVEIACGGLHTVVRMSDGTVFSTGRNLNGQLGLGNTTQQNSLTQINIPENKTPSQIACGNTHTIVLMSDGTIFGTGNNSNGHLGTGNTTQQTSLTQMTNSTGKTPTQIACGINHTIVLMSDGTIFGTGNNGQGSLGTGNTTQQTSLTQMTNSTGKTPLQIISGVSSYHTIVRMTDGTSFATGINNEGQLGVGNTTQQNSLTQMNIPAGKTISQFGCGDRHTVALMSDGTIFGAGTNSNGQLGLLVSRFLSNLPTLPVGKIPFQVACGNTHAIVLMTDGTIFGTGNNGSGQLGTGNTTTQSSLTQMTIPVGKTPFQIASGSNHTIVLMSDGTIFSTGSNSDGQLGLGNTTNRNSLTQINIPVGKTPRQIACGSNHTIVLMTDGTIFGTGRNNVYQLGIGDTSVVTSLTQMTNTTGRTPSQISCGSDHNIVLMTDNTIFGCGSNSNGQLGGSGTERVTLTQMTNSTGKTPSIIACGNGHTMVLMTDGTIFGTGRNGEGQLGTGNTTQRTVLTQMTNSTGKTPLDIACGNTHTIVLMSDGTLFVTGQNTSAQLGIGNISNQSSLLQARLSSSSFLTNVKNIMNKNSIKPSPTITNFSIPSKTIGDSSFNIVAPTSNSSGAFSYTSSNTSVATISGNTITIVGAGSTTITATQESTADYNSGSITASLVVSKVNPTITNFSVSAKTFGDSSFNIVAPTSNSSGAFSYTSSNTSVATISGTTITIVGVGSSTITATQSSTTDYNSGSITASLVVSKANPTLTNFSIPSKTTLDSSFNIVAPTSNSSGAFSYTSSNLSVATISGNTITIVGAGSTTITATQASTSNYNSDSITTSLVVSKVNPTITNFSFSAKTFGDSSFNIVAPTSNSSGAFSYTSSNTSVATISGTTITIVGAGSSTITATQATTTIYDSGSITASLVVSKANPTLTNFSIPVKTFDDSSFNIVAPTSNSSGEFSYTSSNTSVATISGNTIIIVGLGSTTITATQATTSNYNSGSITATFQVNKLRPNVGAFDIPNQTLDNSTYTIINPTKPNDHTGSWSYTSSNNNIASILGNVITFISTGIVRITATLSEDQTYMSISLFDSFSIAESNSIPSNFQFINTETVNTIVPLNVTPVNNIVVIPNTFTQEQINLINPSEGTIQEKIENTKVLISTLFENFSSDVNASAINIPSQIIFTPPIYTDILDTVKLVNSVQSTIENPTIIDTTSLTAKTGIFTYLDNSGNSIILNGSNQFVGFTLKIIRQEGVNYTIIRTDNLGNSTQSSAVINDLITYAGMKVLLG